MEKTKVEMDDLGKSAGMMATRLHPSRHGVPSKSVNPYPVHAMLLQPLPPASPSAGGGQKAGWWWVVGPSCPMPLGELMESSVCCFDFVSAAVHLAALSGLRLSHGRNYPLKH